VLIGAVVLVLGLLGVGFLAILHIRTEQGTYAIETDDPDFTFQVAKGSVVLHDRKTDKKYELKVVRQDQAKGENELEVSEGNADLHFPTKNFTIKRGEKVALKAWLARKEADPNQAAPVLDDAWHKQVASLPPAKQVEAVAAKLKELNPGWAGNLALTKVEGGMVREIAISAPVKDISSLRALTGLRTLNFDSWGDQSDLAPLKGMPLTVLLVHSTQVSDLSPLKDMPLTDLNCHSTRVSDLTPLKGMPLTHLDIHETPVTDLSPLKGMPLKVLWCDFNAERDAALLRSIKTLETINGKPAAEFWKEVEARKQP
jgi:Leucine-rich repeat (LRR) protein